MWILNDIKFNYNNFLLADFHYFILHNFLSHMTFLYLDICKKKIKKFYRIISEKKNNNDLIKLEIQYLYTKIKTNTQRLWKYNSILTPVILFSWKEVMIRYLTELTCKKEKEKN